MSLYNMKSCYVVLFIFNFARSEIIYSMYDISGIPTLDKLCGLTKDQISAAQSSIKNNHTSSSPTHEQQQSPMKVFATCSGKDCLKQQRELVDCLTYEEVASRGLDEQLMLDIRSLTGQLSAATDTKERTIATLFDLSNRLEAAFCDYRLAAAAADASTRELAHQRDVVRDGYLRVEYLRDQLSEAKSEAAACSKIGNDGTGRDFGVYATGCGPSEQQRNCDNRVTSLPAKTVTPYLS